MTTSSITPAYRIETPRLVLRCWEPRDAALLKTAIDENLDHLQPWMPWAVDEPTDLDTKVAALRRFRSDFDADREYIYAIFNADESVVLGGTGFDPREGNALEIGYWIHVAHLNRGFATEAAAALTQAAFALHHAERLEIHCDPANVRSAAVPRKLGYTHEATLRRRIPHPGHPLRDDMIWTLLPEEYPATLAAGLELTAYDAAGHRLI